MQGRSHHEHVQSNTASAHGLFLSVSTAGGGMLRKCRGDCSIHESNLQWQRRAKLLTSYAPSPTVLLWEEERELKPEKNSAGEAESVYLRMDSSHKLLANPGENNKLFGLLFFHLYNKGSDGNYSED